MFFPPFFRSAVKTAEQPEQQLPVLTGPEQSDFGSTKRMREFISKLTVAVRRLGRVKRRFSRPIINDRFFFYIIVEKLYESFASKS